MDPLLKSLTQWRPFTALVIGDFMLDQLQFGDADRLTADAPVPVLHVKRCEDRPGGAANVCLDLVEMNRPGGRVRAFGVCGDDSEGHLLRRALESAGVDAGGLLTDTSRPTTVKRSLIGLAQGRHPQKMFRVDFESSEPLDEMLSEKLIAAVDAALAGADVVCIEDYGKGVCTESVCQKVIERATSAGIPVLVDPARTNNFSRYRGATAVTPNRTEAELATGLKTDGEARPDHNVHLAQRLMDDLAIQVVVLTLDKHGALLLERGQKPVAVPTVAREVYDVTGAGDMMLAALAAARANEIPWHDAVRFANAAAGLEVEVFGVVPLPLEKIHHELLLRDGQMHGKLRTLEQVLVQVAAQRREGRKVVFTNGCFDILHAGHVSLLERAAAEGDFLIVGLNDDASVSRIKGPTRPVNNQEDRARVLGALSGVAAVVLFGEDTPRRLIEAIRPDVLVKGADYRRDQVVGGDIVEASGGRIALIDLVDGKSTTGVIAKMRAGS